MHFEALIITATYDPGCAARPGALVLDPFGIDCELEFADPLKLA
jgi:hypothetical protein